MSNLALLVVTQSFSSPCCEDTFPDLGRHLKKMLLPSLATRRKGTNRGCNSLRQEAGTGGSSRSFHSRSPTKQFSPYSDFYREKQHWVANLRQPLLVTQEPTLTCPCSGGRVQGAIYICVPQERYQSGCAWSRITSARAQGHFHNGQLDANCNLLFKTQFQVLQNTTR